MSTEAERPTRKDNSLVMLSLPRKKTFWDCIGIKDGGERGIRTPGTRKRTIDFESTAFDHSAISPRQWVNGLYEH